MTEKREILLEVKTQMATSIKEIADLNHRVADLRAEEQKLGLQMQQMAKDGKENTQTYRALEQQLAANKEAQKALRKEITDKSRQVQNLIVVENQHANTLKAKAALLSVEKDRLRTIELEEGKLSEAYIRQRKVVADLNAEVTKMEREYGVHSRNVGNYESAADGFRGMLSKVRMELLAVGAVLAAGVKLLKGYFDTLREQSQAIGDWFTIEFNGIKTAYQELVRTMVSGEGWSQLIANLRTAYENGKKVAEMLDEIFERQNSLNIAEAQYAEEIERDRIRARNTALTNEERLAAAENVIRKEAELAAMRRDIAKQEFEANKLALQQKTQMTDADIEYYINNYNQNRDAILEAENFVAKEAELRGKIASETQVRNYKRREELEAELKALQDGLSAEAQGVLEVVRKYEQSSDEITTNYVNSYTKYQKVNAEFERANARTMLQRDRMLKEVAGEEQKNYENTIKEQDEALKAQEKAVAAYVATITKIYDDLDNARLTDTERLVKAVKVQYQEQTRALAEQVRAGMMSWEEYMYYRVALSQKASAEIAAINKEAQDKEAQEREKAIAEEARARREQLQTDLQVAWNNAEEQFRIKREYLLKELALSELSAERRAELEQQLSELMKEHTESRIQMAMDYAGQLEQAFGAVNDIAKNMSQSRIQDAEAENAQEKAALEKRLKAGLISQKQYDDKLEKMDAELAAKKAIETRKQAERDKALALFQAAINTASAIVKVWTDVPTMIAPAFTAIVAGVGALQTAAIASQPLPKARKGGRVEGPTHEGGGVLVETEGDERIVAAQPSRVFPELLNLISYIGKNAGIPQTGFAERFIAQQTERTAGRTTTEVDYDRIAELFGEKVAQVMKDFKFWLSVKEFRDEEDNIVRMEELTKQ